MSLEANSIAIGQIRSPQGSRKKSPARRCTLMTFFPEMIYGAATVRSSIPRDASTNICFEGDMSLGRVHDRHAKDIPGENYVALILNDQPYLADEVVIMLKRR